MCLCSYSLNIILAIRKLWRLHPFDLESSWDLQLIVQCGNYSSMSQERPSSKPALRNTYTWSGLGNTCITKVDGRDWPIGVLSIAWVLSHIWVSSVELWRNSWGPCERPLYPWACSREMTELAKQPFWVFSYMIAFWKGQGSSNRKYFQIIFLRFFHLTLYFSHLCSRTYIIKTYCSVVQVSYICGCSGPWCCIAAWSLSCHVLQSTNSYTGC